MPGETRFDSLLDAMARTPPPEPQAFLMDLRTEYGLDHVLYADIGRAGDAFRPARLLHDPNPALERLVRSHRIWRLSPLFAAVERLYGPTEIDPRRIDPGDQTFATALAGCGLDRLMLVFPLVPSRPGLAFFACNSSASAGWNRPVRALLRDIAALAGIFHARQQATAIATRAAAGHDASAPRLTPREREILQWVADGKTYWEIARIVGISERTVRHFMANCRDKLDAVSNKQAVAKAVAAALIDVRHTPPRHQD